MNELMKCTTCGGKLSATATVCPHCGEDGGASKLHEKEYIKLESKSRLVSLILTTLFGPLGLMYSSLKWGLVLAIVAVIGAATFVITIAIWIISIIVGDSATYRHNQRVIARSKLIK